MSNEQNRDELWPKHPLNDVQNAKQNVLVPRSLEELYVSEEESFINEDSEEFDLFFSALKNTDDVALPESGIYFDALEARIMGALDAAIDAGEVEDRDSREPAAVEIINSMVAKRAAGRRAAAIRAGQTVMFVAVALVMTGKWLIAPTSGKPTTTKAFARSQNLARATSARSTLRATHAAAPKVLTGTVMSHESKDDLALEIAARRLVAYHKSK